MFSPKGQSISKAFDAYIVSLNFPTIGLVAFKVLALNPNIMIQNGMEGQAVGV